MTKESKRSASDGRPIVVLSANSCHNLVHSRRRLLEALDAAGFQVVAIAPADRHFAELGRLGIELWPIRIARSGTNPLADARLLLRYIGLLRRLRPSAYLGFTIKPNVYGSIAARVCGVPSVANVTGLGTSFLAQGALWRLTEIIYQLAFLRAHTIFFQNFEDFQIFTHKRLIQPRQGRVVPGDGVDLKHFRPADEPISPPEERSFLFIGRFLRDKGVREFVDAARMLRSKFPRARFQLLGNIDPGNRTSITTAEFESWLAEGVVEYLGEHQDVRPFIRSATAIVLPSYREGLARTLLEGAAMGKPLVGTDVAGVREVVEEGVTGALCEPRDGGSLAAAMERIAAAPIDTLKRLGANARKKVEQDFDEEIVVRAYLEVLRDIMARR